jgi:cystathionine gamma-lyase
LRMERHQHNALKIAEYLQQHPRVTRVIYPGLSDHPAHALAKKQMSGFGAVVTFGLDGDVDAVENVLNALNVFAIAEGLGGVESMVGHPYTMSHSSMSDADKSELGITPDLIRLSPGIEHVDDLIADLDQALRC